MAIKPKKEARAAGRVVPLVPRHKRPRTSDTASYGYFVTCPFPLHSPLIGVAALLSESSLSEETGMMARRKEKRKGETGEAMRGSLYRLMGASSKGTSLL